MRARTWVRNGVMTLAALLPALATATVVTFSGSGLTSLTGRIGGFEGLELAVDDAPYSFTFPGSAVENDWLQDSLFVVDGLARNAPTASHGHATYFNNRGDTLELDFDGLPVGGGSDFVVMRLTYNIVGGTGRFAQARGTGFEDVTITLALGPPFAFNGEGQLQIPEPGGLALLLAGLPLLAIGGRGFGCGRATGAGKAGKLVRSTVTAGL